MRVCIVRTVARLPALPNASAKHPRLNVRPCPYPAPSMIGIALALSYLPLEYWGQSSAKRMRTSQSARSTPSTEQMETARRY